MPVERNHAFCVGAGLTPKWSEGLKEFEQGRRLKFFAGFRLPVAVEPTIIFLS
jgi:hypothetical protein